MSNSQQRRDASQFGGAGSPSSQQVGGRNNARRPKTILFGINIDPAATSRHLALDLAHQADDLGLDLIGIQDHPYIGGFLDTLTLLTYLGAKTPRVQLLTNVADLPLRPPAMLAKAAASLDVLTEGRVVLGLGAGAQWDAIAGYGGPRRTPAEAVEATAEALAVMRAIWSGSGEATYEGHHYQLHGAQRGPTPPRPIPIWLGVYRPRMLRLVGHKADGWSPSEPYAPPEQIPKMQRIIDEAAEAAGRDPSTIRRNYNVMGTIQTDSGSRLRPRQPGMVFAPVAEWVERIVRYTVELRLDSFVYWPVAGQEREQLRLWAEEVMPAVREQLGL